MGETLSIAELIETVTGSIEKTAMPAGVPAETAAGVAGSNLPNGTAQEAAAAGAVQQAVMDAKEQVVSANPDSPIADQTANTPEDAAVAQADALSVAAGTDLQVRSDVRTEEDTNTAQVVGSQMEEAVKAAVEKILTEAAEAEKTAAEQAEAEEVEMSKMAEDAMAYGALIADGFVARLSEYQEAE